MSRASHFGSKLMILTALVAALAVGAATLLWNWAGQQDREADARRSQRKNNFDQAASGVIVWLQQQHATHGAYPTSIPQEVRAPLDRVEPGWSYSISTNGSNCYIGFGDYMKDGFQRYWSSERNEWMTDS